MGSFANCLIWRLYKQETIGGRSYCPLCRHSLAWYDNIPLLSYLNLRGRCRFCHKRISRQYPVVELMMALLFLFFWFKHLDFLYLDIDVLMVTIKPLSFWLYLIRDWLAVFIFSVIFVFDARFYLVSNAIVFPASLCFIILNLFLGASWFTLLLTIIVAGLFFALQFFITRGRGLGEGDIWLGLLLGTLFPDWGLLIVAILSAYLIGTFVGLGLIIVGRKSWGSKLPLGVFLALGAIIALAWGPAIISSYWRLF